MDRKREHTVKTPAPVFAPGDWNLGTYDVEQIAARIGGELVTGRGPDHAIARGVKVGKVTRLNKYGSDHHAILFDLHLPTGENLRVLWWNVYVGSAPEHVLEVLQELQHKHQPHIIALCEAYRLRGLPLAGYRLIQGHRAPGLAETEAADVALMIRRDLALLNTGRVAMRLRWTGPVHDKPRGPRRYVRARVRTKRGFVLRVLAVHMPTGGLDGPNAAAVHESINRIVRWAGGGKRHG